MNSDQEQYPPRFGTVEATLTALNDTHDMLNNDIDPEVLRERVLHYCSVLGSDGYGTSSASLFTALESGDANRIGRYNEKLMLHAMYPRPTPPYRDRFERGGPADQDDLMRCLEKISRAHRVNSSVFSTLGDIVRQAMVDKEEVKVSDHDHRHHVAWAQVILQIPTCLHLLNIGRMFSYGMGREVVKLAVNGDEKARNLIVLPGYVESSSDWEVVTRYSCGTYLIRTLVQKAIGTYKVADQKTLRVLTEGKSMWFDVCQRACSGPSAHDGLGEMPPTDFDDDWDGRSVPEWWMRALNELDLKGDIPFKLAGNPDREAIARRYRDANVEFYRDQKAEAIERWRRKREGDKGDKGDGEGGEGGEEDDWTTTCLKRMRSNEEQEIEDERKTAAKRSRAENELNGWMVSMRANNVFMDTIPMERVAEKRREIEKRLGLS